MPRFLVISCFLVLRQKFYSHSLGKKQLHIVSSNKIKWQFYLVTPSFGMPISPVRIMILLSHEIIFKTQITSGRIYIIIHHSHTGHKRARIAQSV